VVLLVSIETWRLLNAALAVVVFVLLCVDLRRRWPHVERSTLYFALALLGFSAVFVARAFVPDPVAVALASSALLWTLFGVVCALREQR
jgi:hypothetical protein